MGKQRGFFGIGIINGKTESNIGTLWRSANLLGANFIFTIGSRYPKKQATDTMKTPFHVPLFEYENFEAFEKNLPRNAELIAVELDERSKPIETLNHPKCAVYILGAEDKGIPQDVLAKCKRIIQLPGDYSMNVSVAGSIIMYDRILKASKI